MKRSAGVHSLPPSRSARARLALVVPVTFAVGCSLLATPRDEATQGNGSRDAMELDGSALESATAQESSTPSEGAAQDAADIVEGGAVGDGDNPRDTGSLLDVANATDAMDAMDATDATDMTDAAEASPPCSCTLPHMACGDAGVCLCLPYWGNCRGGSGCPDDLTTDTNCGVCGLACNACCGALCLSHQTCKQLAGGTYACQC